MGLEGDVVVHGSIRLARTLLEHDVVDELRLTPGLSPASRSRSEPALERLSVGAPAAA